MLRHGLGRRLVAIEGIAVDPCHPLELLQRRQRRESEKAGRLQEADGHRPAHGHRSERTTQDAQQREQCDRPQERAQGGEGERLYIAQRYLHDDPGIAPDER